MAPQRESFLQPGQHEVSKKHGKLRTKFDRLAIAGMCLFNFGSICTVFVSTNMEHHHEIEIRKEES